MLRGGEGSPWDDLTEWSREDPDAAENLSLRPLLLKVPDSSSAQFLLALATITRAHTLGEFVTTPRVQEEVKRLPVGMRDRVAEALWSAIRAHTEGAVIRPSGPVTETTDPPEDREGAVQWAQHLGLQAWLDVPISTLASAVRRYLAGSSAISALLVRDVFDPPRMGRLPASQNLSFVTSARLGARRALGELGGHVRRARADRSTFLARAEDPAQSAASALLQRIVERRDARLLELPTPAPLGLGYPADRVTFQDRPPSFHVHPASEHLLGRIPDVDVALEPELTLEFLRIGTPDGYERSVPIVALSAVIDALRDPESEAGRAAIAWAVTPPWQRTMQSIERRLPAAEPKAAGRLAFRLEPSPAGLRVRVLMQTPTATGFTKGRVISPDDLRGRTSTDRLEAKILKELDQSRGMLDRVETARKEHDLLIALSDHPRVYFGATGEPARIRRARFLLELEPQGDDFAPKFRLGGAPRSAATIANAEREGFLIDVEEESRTVTLARLDPTARVLVHAFAEQPAAFPPEAVDSLLTLIASREVDLDLSLPDSLLGKTIDADSRPITRLTSLAENGLLIELRVRPIPSGNIHEPGAGSERVLGSAEGERVSAHRSLAREEELAEAVVAGLPLEGAHRDERWTLRAADAEHAADVMVTLAEMGEAIVIEWADANAALRVIGTATRGNLRVQVAKRRDWFGVDGQVDVAGVKVDLAALLEAARAGHRYVRLGQGRVLAIAKELREKLVLADDALQVTQKGLDASPVAMLAIEELVEKESQLQGAKEWFSLRERMRKATDSQPEIPANLTAELRPYQVEGYRWLARLASWSAGGCLADDMGLGKTVQMLALLLHRANDGPALVIAPTSVCANWIAEAARFAPSLRTISYRGKNRSALLSELAKGDVLIASYDLLARDGELISKVHFSTMVLDEAQAVKNANSQRAIAARTVHADVRFAMSGTPVENHLGELWSLFRIVSPGLLGSWEKFRSRFAAPIERDRDPKRRAALATLLRPFLLRRTKALVAPELPPRIEIQRTITLTTAERDRYEVERVRALDTMATAPEGVDRRFMMLAAITKLRRLACHPRLVDPGSNIASSKLAALLELVDELREGDHKALIFSQFTTHLDLVREALDARKIRYVSLQGDTPADDRARRCAEFQAGQYDLFLISLKAGGTGLNLTAADTVVHLDPWWNPAAEDQASDRAHRIGQTKPVTVVRLIARGTIEEAVVSLHKEKRELAESLLTGTEGGARLSVEEMAALVRAGEVEGEEALDPFGGIFPGGGRNGGTPDSVDTVRPR